MAHLKNNLPTKICLQCKRKFGWRKKWARVWPEVRFCSKKCKSFKTKLHEPIKRL